MLKKTVRFALVILAVSPLTFLMVNLLPGDVAYIVGGEEATLAEIEAIRKNLGLDQKEQVTPYLSEGQLKEKMCPFLLI